MISYQKQLLGAEERQHSCARSSGYRKDRLAVLRLAKQKEGDRITT